MRYEVQTKDEENLTYGIWDNNMVAWKYISDWNGTETIDLERANQYCDSLNAYFYSH